MATRPSDQGSAPAVTRREFMGRGAAAGAVALGPGSHVLRSVLGANERIGVGVIGVGGRGGAHLKTWHWLMEQAGLVDIVAVCDVYRPRLDRAAKDFGAKAYMDHRELLADPRVDVVSIATPDHHHGYQALDAVKAGKHVYCEKPLTHWRQFELTKQLLKAVQASGRVFIAGTQPTQPDNLYRPVDIDVVTGLPATADTPRDRIETRVFLMLPAEAREWARDNGIPQLAMTNENPQPASNIQSPTANFQVRVTRPDNGTIYRITPQTPIATQRIPVQAIVADGMKLRTLTLLVDGQAIGEFTTSPARAFWQLQLGAHTITAKAIDEQGQTFESEPVRIVVTQ